MKKRLTIILLMLGFLVSCDKALDPLANGFYTDDNIGEYPSIIKGFVDKAYSLVGTNLYNGNEYAMLDCATDNGVATSTTAAMRKFAGGALSPSEDPFKEWWSRDYEGIWYVNRFLQDRIGINTRYMRDEAQDELIRRNYQGDAFALRAWFGYDLLRKFGGKGADGKLYGYPIMTAPVPYTPDAAAALKRDSFDACVEQILSDCDSALVYLPVANRDWLAVNTAVQGSCRWTRFDGMSVIALKALTCLLWASDAFNPDSDVTRWEKAATFAGQAMRLKIDEDGHHGFLPLSSFSWMDPNTPEAFWISAPSAKTGAMEKDQYPTGFNGSCKYAPSQELVDAFPGANGYPVTDSRSGYDPKHPYLNRDPRFYSTIFYNGCELTRQGDASDIMYTFDMSVGGRDMNGLVGNGLTNYYLRKFTYAGWNASDQSVQTMPRAVIHIGWRDMCLALAEAANRAVGPLDNRYGWSARDALAYIRSRSTADGKPGLGYGGDPYLDECAADRAKFEALVRNERRLEFCFEGKRLADLIRWGVSLEERNRSVHRVKILVSGSVTAYSSVVTDERALPSVWTPLPYAEIVNAPSMVQNEGWETWSNKK